MASARLIRSASTRKVSQAENSYHDAAETTPLLEDTGHEHHPEVEENPPIATPDPKRRHPFQELPIYENIWRIRREITARIIDPYSLEQLRAPRLNSTVVRPLMNEFYDLEDISVVYCLLVNRVQFLKEQSYQAHYQSVNTSRALLCEILALKILRQYDEDSVGRKGLLLLANILIAGFEPFQNCPNDINELHARLPKWTYLDQGSERRMAALEIAIISESKLFLSSPACQRVVDAIYVGFVIYSPTSFIDLIPDRYKHQPIALYNPRKAHLLNQYRLIVPRTRNAIEICQFIVLLVLYIMVMAQNDRAHFTIRETVFCVYSFGWILDQIAAILEHGWEVYTQNLWSFLDVAFGIIYLIYFSLRMQGLRTGDFDVERHSMDWLALGAPFLIPRLAFNIFSENIVFVALREMMTKFFLLTLLAVWSFAGFFLAMSWVGEGYDSPITIGKWMVYVWFGLDGEGIERSTDFHWLLGPVLMITFAILGNTLFLTILVSTLSSTFSNILRHSAAEVQFRRAVLTLQSVKSDAIFAYMPPFNMLALTLLVPLKLLLSPRWFHKVHIGAVKVLNAPLLLLISWFERHSLADWIHEDERVSRQGQHRKRGKMNRLLQASRLHPFHGDILAVFEHEPPEREQQQQEESGDEEYEDGNNAQAAGARDGDGDDDTHSPNSDAMDGDEAETEAKKPRSEHTQARANPEQKDERVGISRSNTGASNSSGQMRRRSSVNPRRKSSTPGALRAFGGVSRRETVWSDGGVEAQMAGILEDHETANSDLMARLQGLESGMKRVEKMMKRVIETVEEEGDDEAAGAGNVDDDMK